MSVRADSVLQPENLALISPDRDWQDRLQTLLNNSRGSGTQYAQAPGPYALPSLRQIASPSPSQSQALMSNVPVSYPTKLESPVSQSTLLAPLTTYNSSSTGGSYSRMWDSSGFGSMQRAFSV